MKLPVAITEEEFTQLIKNTYKKHHKIAFLFGYGSGLRISEIAGQKKLKSYCCDDYLYEFKYLDEDKKKRISYKCKKCNSVVDKAKCRPSQKEGDWEYQPLNSNQIDMKQKSMRILGKGNKERIVPLPKGFKESYLKYIPIKCGVRSLQRSFKMAAKRAGLLEIKPNLHFHSLRHSFATRLVSQGVPIHHIRTMLGHSNISTTNVYLEANPIDALKSYEDHF